MELAKVKVQEIKCEFNKERLKEYPSLMAYLELLINLHAWNHRPGPALLPKWLDHYTKPHNSSEILTRSDLPTWLNPKPGGSGPQNCSSCAWPLLGGLGTCSLRRF